MVWECLWVLEHVELLVLLAHQARPHVHRATLRHTLPSIQAIVSATLRHTLRCLQKSTDLVVNPLLSLDVLLTWPHPDFSSIVRLAGIQANTIVTLHHSPHFVQVLVRNVHVPVLISVPIQRFTLLLALPHVNGSPSDTAILGVEAEGSVLVLQDELNNLLVHHGLARWRRGRLRRWHHEESWLWSRLSRLDI